MSDLDPQILKDRVVLVTDGDILAERPKLAVHVGKIAAFSSELDTRLGLLLAELIGAESKVALQMYLGLKGARRPALIGAGEHGLSEPGDLSDFKKLMKSVSKAFDKRDFVVHGHWSFTKEMPDALIHTDPNESVAWLAELLSPTENVATHIAKVKNHPVRRIYREENFVAIEKKIQEATIAVINFRMSLWMRRKKGQ